MNQSVKEKNLVNAYITVPKVQEEVEK